MMYRGYLAIENLGLNTNQRTKLVDALKALGPAEASQPAHLCHWRMRLDSEAAIFEAQFQESALTVDALKARLGAIFSVSPALIDHVLSSVTFADRQTPIVVFSRGGTDYLRFALFGGPAATWEQSRIEVLAYLAANRVQWESEIE